MAKSFRRRLGVTYLLVVSAQSFTVNPCLQSFAEADRSTLPQAVFASTAAARSKQQPSSSPTALLASSKPDLGFSEPLKAIRRQAPPDTKPPIESVKASAKNAVKDAVKVPAEESIKEAVKDAVKVPSKESIKQAVKATSKETSKETSKDIAKEPVEEAAKWKASTMEARFGKLILKQVDGVLQQEPCRDSLLQLLKIAEPDFLNTSLENVSERTAALKALKLLIHPDKHPGSEDATRVFQTTQNFYDLCCENLGRRRQRQRKPPVDLPLEFHVRDKWPYLGELRESTLIEETPLYVPNNVTVSKASAYQCINYRGWIAHGKRADLSYSFEHVWEDNCTSVREVFDSKGGTKTFLDTADIKQEIMEYGPVLSTTLELTPAFMSANDHASSFEIACIDQAHPLLIVGWTLSSFGEMWLVQPVRGDADIPIAIGHFSIDDEILAPANDFRQTPWQDPTLAVDIRGLTDLDWYNWPGLTSSLNDSELKVLAGKLGCGLAEAISTQKQFVVRNEAFKARSRAAYVKEIMWDDPSESWQVELIFCPDQ